MSAAFPKFDFLLVEDDRAHALLIERCLGELGGRVEHVETQEVALDTLRRRRFDLVVLDIGLPDGSGLEIQRWLGGRIDAPPVVCVTQEELAEQAVAAMRAGAYDYVIKRPRYLERLSSAVDTLLAPHRRSAAPPDGPCRELLGESDAMRLVRRRIDEFGACGAPVLVLGETGTGKELVARALHETGGRRGGPFVAVNCAAIHPSLFESEVFGSARGAYTGADRDRPGFVAAARGGTLFLDELAELPLEVQPKLLRLLEDSTYRPVGSAREERADLRVIAATHRELGERVQQGRFRADLWYRLDVLRILLPSLRDRKGDIPLLVEHFLRRLGGPTAPAVDPEALSPALQWPWPGNVRELRNVVERTLVLHRGGPLRSLAIVSEDDSWSCPSTSGGDDLIERLARHEGKLERVASELGVSVRTVQRQMKSLQLRRGDFRLPTR